MDNEIINETSAIQENEEALQKVELSDEEIIIEEAKELSRSQAREMALQFLFAYAVNDDMDFVTNVPLSDEELSLNADDFCKQLVETTLNNMEEIDSTIKGCLKGWTLDRLPAVSRTILRLSAAQMLFMKDIGTAVVINEAVELSKKYGDEKDYTFINGALGALSRKA